MPETRPAVLDIVQSNEKPADTPSQPVLAEHDTKEFELGSIAAEDTIEPQDVSGSSSSSPALERWNNPRINMYRYFTALYSFIIMGMNDAATGVSFQDLHCPPVF